MASEPLRKQRPSILRPSPDEEKTKDIPPPEKIREMLAKGQMNQAVGEMALELSSERLKLDQEMAEAKTKLESTVREDHESTKVFNLAQLRASAEVEELATKKQEVEKEINDLLSMKNSKMHEDLQKVTRFLVQETKRIAPLIENSAKTSKANSNALEATSNALEKGLDNLGDLKSMISTLHQDFKNDAKTLNSEKHEMKSEISTILNEVKTVVEGFYRNKNEYDLLEAKKKEVKKEIADLMIKLLPMSEKWKSENESYEKLLAEKHAVSLDYNVLISQKHEIEQDLSKVITSGKEGVVRLHEEKIKLEEEKIKLEERISILRISISELNPEVEHNRTLLGELEIVYNQLTEEVAKSEDHLKSVNNEIREETFKLNHAKEELEYTRINVKDLTLERETLCLELSKLENDINDGKIKLNEEKIKLEEELAGLRYSLNEITPEVKQKRTTLQELERELSHLQKVIATTEEKQLDLADRTREENFKLYSAKEELDSAKAGMKDLYHEKDSLNSAIKTLKQEFHEIKFAAMHADEKIANYRKSVTEAELSFDHQIELLKKDHALNEEKLTLQLRKTEDEFKRRADSVEKDFQMKRAHKEQELKQMEEKMLAELKAKLGEAEKGIAEFLKRNQDDLTDTISDVVYVKGQYGLVKAETAPPMDELKEEIKKVIGMYFKQTVMPHHKDKLLQKMTLYWAIGATTLATISMILFYFKR